MRYDYLVVGSGLFGSVFSRLAKDAGRSVLVIDKRNHVGGNVYTENQYGIDVHMYGPHIFHTKSKRIWDFVNKFTEFNSYRHKVLATYNDKIYSLPFNLATFNQFWGCTKPEEAQEELANRRIPIKEPNNLEEFALSQVGEEIYHTLIYGYTKKQWQREPRELPAAILRRIPVRFTYDDNYYEEGSYQGIPVKGYTHLIENLLDGIEVRLNHDLKVLSTWKSLAHKLVYSGPIDELFNCCYGPLEYRSLRFEHIALETSNCQGIAQMNYTGTDVPWTRIVEHKHFANVKTDQTVITYEYPQEWKPGLEKYYPVNDEKNQALFEKYAVLARGNKDVVVGGRLGFFKYFDMDQTIAQAINKAEEEIAI